MAVGTYFPGRGTIVEESYLKGKEEGQAVERALSVLRVLDARQIDTTDAVRARITGCTDLDTLERWFSRALTAGEADDLFVDE
ncbi:hypothetical protein E4198_21065 [Streptomyces sp. RKND-216]|uniref:hypothetical protein n=1 Tax=Streptomyces sp. RKND-216 TaxID=2562581 RepID=UPI00109E18FF|nr:hypothetical protein [Streptomyces sp. RKND-216]THA26820.1 hypothetical protein E4198_21065 [Streptomyces sp. RKND-216]